MRTFYGGTMARGDRVSQSGKAHWLHRMVDVQPGEARGLCWASLFHFCLLCAYYVLRPIRDEMGVQGGVDQLQWLFLATLLAMIAVVPLFGWLTSHMSRQRFLPYSYLFFIANLLGFFVLFRLGVREVHVARTFFVWVSVFNLFVVSVFWSFMSDLFDDAQSKRLFGFIAAGGTAGALAGPAVAGGLANLVGVTNLLLISIALLGVVLICLQRLRVWASSLPVNDQEQVGPGREPGTARQARAAFRNHDKLEGGLWSGVKLVFGSSYLQGICVFMVLYTTLSTFLYFQQAHIVEAALDDPAKRTAAFAGIDFAVNGLSLGFQTLLTGRIVRALGLSWTLSIIPLFLLIGFGALAVAPVLVVFVVVQVLRRAGNYALMKPVREMLYVVLSREEKYKAKNFIDTAVYRGGDAVSAWIFASMRALGLSLGQTALAAVPLSAIWAWVAYRLGKKREALAPLPPAHEEQDTRHEVKPRPGVWKHESH